MELAHEGLSFNKVKEVPASLNGVIKATKFWEVKSTRSGNTGADFPLLVVAIRGTISKSLDWIVNLNYQTQDTKDFLVSMRFFCMTFDCVLTRS